MNQEKIKQLLEAIQQENQEPQDIGKVEIVNVMLWMKDNVCEPTTIKRVGKELRHLERNCNINQPEAVKNYIANKQRSNIRKKPNRILAIFIKSPNLVAL